MDCVQEIKSSQALEDFLKNVAGDSVFLSTVWPFKD